MRSSYTTIPPCYQTAYIVDLSVPVSSGPIGSFPHEYVNMIHQLSPHVSTSPRLVSTDKATLAGRARLGAQRWFFRISLETRDEKRLTRTKRGPSRALFAGLGPTTRLTPESIAPSEGSVVLGKGFQNA